MSNPDMSQYLGVFLDEGQEQLTLLETNVVGLEKSDEPDDLLQVLFRAAHTLKGSSRAMGFLGIGDLTHEMENVLDDLRNHKLHPTTPIVDALLDCIDTLKEQMESVATTGSEPSPDEVGVPPLVARLTELRTGEPAPAPAETASATEAAPSGTETATPTVDADGANVIITVHLASDCLMKGVRAALVLGSLAGLGAVLRTIPDANSIEEEQFESSFQAAMTTDCPVDELREKVMGMPEVRQVDIHEIGEEVEAPVKAAPAKATPAAKKDAPETAKAEAEPAGQAANAKHPPSAPAGHVTQTVRVDVTRLDKLLNLVGELVTDRTQIATIVSNLQTSYRDDPHMGLLVEALSRVGRVTTELQDEVMKSRMLPIDGVFQRMPRMVRDLAQKTNKELDFVMEGGDTEIDRSVLEIIADPIIHLLRNSLDHGIESPEQRIAAGKPRQGLVKLCAKHERSEVLVEVTDDGAGIDPAKMRDAAVNKGVISSAAAETLSDRDSLLLVFAPGFSTAKQVSDISGRGVGMDIVRSNIEKIGGRVNVDSKIGQGSKFTIHLPLTLAIIRALLVSAEGTVYALPLAGVTEMIKLGRSSEDVVQCTTGGQSALLLRGQTMPLVNLAAALRGDAAAVDPRRIDGSAHGVIVRHGSGFAALAVDELQGEQEVVIKPLGSMMSDIPGIAGASILGDGRVALIVDPAKTLEELYSGCAAAA